MDERLNDEPDESIQAVEDVTRSVDLTAEVDEVWQAVADPERRRLWLDDDDASNRMLRVEQIDAGRSLSWTWWHPGDEGSASRVEIALTPIDGGTRLVVHERMLAPPVSSRTMHASLSTASTWDRRLLGMELLLVAAGALVA